MSDTYWGFKRPYAHRTVPDLWSRENGFHFNKQHAFENAQRQPNAIGQLMGEPQQALGAKSNGVLIARDNPVLERPQTPQFCMSTYGLRQRNAWTDTLRDCNPRPYTAGPSFEVYAATLRDARGRPVTAPKVVTGPHQRTMSQRPMSKKARATIAQIVKIDPRAK
mmetsp:Transcript_4279/g.10431  ORF Transcript_4279/g.10431 Transcript_4279/m.10431 type:complete len:165 (-) Transcript_4279:460-954(-)|eukprot:CAMPEP_0178986336 /NCGR_PEP_ID=MMETSP0795-20121207/2650_1 /TAXON_ID=88552 /ORGANISM="Amoebophrya sp., Strain Ameob2" /LENGTH=164 /DNA_ID=CAMNT_0020677391 /DNA_START=313 /DNA_END=807 /DNA_ORIENTATION=+